MIDDFRHDVGNSPEPDHLVLDNPLGGNLRDRQIDVAAEDHREQKRGHGAMGDAEPCIRYLDNADFYKNEDRNQDQCKEAERRSAHRRIHRENNYCAQRVASIPRGNAGATGESICDHIPAISR